MRNKIITILTVLIVIAGITLGFVSGVNLTEVQKDTLLILLIVCGSSALYCFVVGEITRNNSQMDKLWSILPVVYIWIVAVKGGMQPRLVIMAMLATIWGFRLTYNFARKGAYSIKFWSGEEDYRWIYLRKTKYFKNKAVWCAFDFFFISIYQNAIVLAICLPALAAMSPESAAPTFGVIDIVATVLVSFFIIYETIADEQQMSFQTKKWWMINSGKKLNELPEPYNKGFNTTGLWSRSRHPNYLGEQAIWLCMYIFVIGAGVVKFGIFNWTIFGSLLLILLFMGSSTLSEGISSSKYPEYKQYQKVVAKYVPIRKYK